MGIWFLMLGCNLLFPAIMLVGGKLFQKDKPREINWIIGYRTSMSMKNEDTWRFAHKVSGRWMWRIGWGCLLLTVVPMLLVLRENQEVVATVGAMVMCLQMVPILAVIPLTEHALRKTFDKNGNRK
jgi:uncharacterized membrane protein